MYRTQIDWSDDRADFKIHASISTAERFVLAVPGDPAERVFSDWNTAARYAASAAARLRSSGRIEEARDVTISEA
jgi:hypothetical protein